jgi:hypothetical protein
MHALEGRDAQQRSNQRAHFMKNLALAGGPSWAFVLFAGLEGDLGRTVRALRLDPR